MFRVLERATEGHGYEVIVCWLSGNKAGSFNRVANLKIGSTLLRAKSDDVCEHKLAGGLWVVTGKKETENLISEFNAIRKDKGWSPKEFKRVNEWINPQDEE